MKMELWAIIKTKYQNASHSPVISLQIDEVQHNDDQYIFYVTCESPLKLQSGCLVLCTKHEFNGSQKQFFGYIWTAIGKNSKLTVYFRTT